MAKFSVSERLARKVLGQHRSTQRKKPDGRADEEVLTADIVRLASLYGHNGCRRITATAFTRRPDDKAKRLQAIT